MCLYPRLIKNPKYKPNKKNGGEVPYMQDKRVGLVPVGCGMCMECMKQKANAWKTRLLEDIKENRNGNFVTLTFSNESYTHLVKKAQDKIEGIRGYDLDNQVATIAVKDFLNRWRKHNKKSIRHWLVTELGHVGTEHLHLHGILWTDKPQEIQDRWGYGWATIGDGKGRNFVNEQTIGYITKYITKLDVDHKYYKPVILTSPGIGRNYVESYNASLNKFQGDKTKETYTTPGGQQTNLNIYWRNKLYSEEEREKLWINKLDKGEQYIGGVKIKAENSEARAKLLKQAQKQNKRLGYGSPGNWEAKAYEEERRAIKQNERILKKEDIKIIKIEDMVLDKQTRTKDISSHSPGLDDDIPFD